MKDLRQHRGRRVLVATEDGTFEGHVEETSAESLTLTGPAAVADDGGRTSMDGHLVIPASRVLWVQVPR
jgi:hypothetical protein